MARAGGRTLAALQPEQVMEQYGQLVKTVHVWQVLQHRLIIYMGPLGQESLISVEDALLVL